MGGRKRRADSGARLHAEVPPGKQTGAFSEVYELVRRIPPGRVMTYGQIATCLENRLSPRAVGWAMHGCPNDVPWQRVVNASGGCSTNRLHDMPEGFQQKLLEDEGVDFGPRGTLDLGRYRWSPGSPSTTDHAHHRGPEDE